MSMVNKSTAPEKLLLICLFVFFFYNNIDNFLCPFPMKKEKNKLQYHHIICYSLLLQNIALDQSTFEKLTQLL